MSPLDKGIETATLRSPAHQEEQDALIAAHRLSELIGSIYDCAIDPELWPQTIGKICGELRCALGVIQLVDLERSQVRFVKTWNFDMAPLLQQDPGYAET